MKKVNKNLYIDVGFRPTWQDLWIGVYWKKNSEETSVGRRTIVDVYICLLPCVPVLVSFVTWKRSEEK